MCRLCSRIRSPSLPLALVLALFAPLGAEIPPVSWSMDYDAAIADGMSRRRPVLILFDAPPSSTRRKNLLPDLDADPAFTQFAARQLALGTVPAPGLTTDAAAERRVRQLRANHGIGSLPALVLIDPDGRTLGSPSLTSRQTAAQLARAIERLIPPALRIAATNATAIAPSGPLTIDLTRPTNLSHSASMIDLNEMRREGSAPPHPALIVIPPGEVTGTNVLNRRLPR